jgi:teichuronic acid biosynthesis glycosyltransferase TuaH
MYRESSTALAIRTELEGPEPLRAPVTGEVVFAFSYLSWGAAARRGWFGTEDRLARGLVTHEQVQRVLICDRARSLPLKLLRDRLARDAAPFPADERRQLLAPVRLRRRDPAALNSVRRTFASYGREMERGARRMGLEDPVVITTHPLVAGFAELSWARAVTYYALDEWTAHPAYSRWWAAYRASYRCIRERGHRVAAVSDALLRSLMPTGASCVVPNGLEPSEWLDQPIALRPSADRRGPLLVYAGSLDARLDVEWLRETARAMPQATLALVGPLVDAAHLQPLRGEPNVTIRAPLARAELATLIRSADVGLIPHRRSSLTDAMSPLKLYEYLAGGLPVAATDLEPMRGIDDRVVLVGEGGDFPAAVRAAHALGRARESERCAFVRANSWRSRHDALLELALG